MTNHPNDGEGANSKAADFVSSRLRYSLSGLALPADQQLSLFSARAHTADEIALEFDEAALPYLPIGSRPASEEQQGMLNKLLAFLSEMSDDKSLWTDEALRLRSEWRQVRLLAKDALQSFGWDVAIPMDELREFYSA